ncbi:unnamed protein product [Vitrella brassicaformis CCMP3155]|uniref:Uncharacterized protein n=1 Tax=Vitrella brassicaformis (strain CCMP3155) TaxID=1169540 RepID=A0A0G4F7T9_VITBC|nr:unnamed protein product [Vitrella brassicaformis CCMP3155]|eukprot:CEM08611.1 unnamed protein product [Vitrella brassicaformis CCMP3155]
MEALLKALGDRPDEGFGSDLLDKLKDSQVLGATDCSSNALVQLVDVVMEGMQGSEFETSYCAFTTVAALVRLETPVDEYGEELVGKLVDCLQALLHISGLDETDDSFACLVVYEAVTLAAGCFAFSGDEGTTGHKIASDILNEELLASLLGLCVLTPTAEADQFPDARSYLRFQHAFQCLHRGSCDTLAVALDVGPSALRRSFEMSLLERPALTRAVKMMLSPNDVHASVGHAELIWRGLRRNGRADASTSEALAHLRSEWPEALTLLRSGMVDTGAFNESLRTFLQSNPNRHNKKEANLVSLNGCAVVQLVSTTDDDPKELSTVEGVLDVSMYNLSFNSSAEGDTLEVPYWSIDKVACVKNCVTCRLTRESLRDCVTRWGAEYRIERQDVAAIIEQNTHTVQVQFALSGQVGIQVASTLCELSLTAFEVDEPTRDDEAAGESNLRVSFATTKAAKQSPELPAASPRPPQTDTPPSGDEAEGREAEGQGKKGILKRMSIASSKEMRTPRDKDKRISFASMRQVVRFDAEQERPDCVSQEAMANPPKTPTPQPLPEQEEDSADEAAKDTPGRPPRTNRAVDPKPSSPPCQPRGRPCPAPAMKPPSPPSPDSLPSPVAPPRPPSPPPVVPPLPRDSEQQNEPEQHDEEQPDEQMEEPQGEQVSESEQKRLKRRRSVGAKSKAKPKPKMGLSRAQVQAKAKKASAAARVDVEMVEEDRDQEEEEKEEEEEEKEEPKKVAKTKKRKERVEIMLDEMDDVSADEEGDVEMKPKHDLAKKHNRKVDEVVGKSHKEFYGVERPMRKDDGAKKKPDRKVGEVGGRSGKERDGVEMKPHKAKGDDAKKKPDRKVVKAKSKPRSPPPPPRSPSPPPTPPPAHQQDQDHDQEDVVMAPPHADQKAVPQPKQQKPPRPAAPKAAAAKAAAAKVEGKGELKGKGDGKRKAPLLLRRLSPSPVDNESPKKSPKKAVAKPAVVERAGSEPPVKPSGALKRRAAHVRKKSPAAQPVVRDPEAPPTPPRSAVHKRGQGDLLHDWLESPSLDWEDLGVSFGRPVNSAKRAFRLTSKVPPKAKPKAAKPKAKATKVVGAGGGVAKRAGGGGGGGGGGAAGKKRQGAPPAKPPAKKKQRIDNNKALKPVADRNDDDGMSLEFGDDEPAPREPRLQPHVRVAASAIDRALKRKDTDLHGLIRMLESKLQTAENMLKA